MAADHRAVTSGNANISRLQANLARGDSEDDSSLTNEFEGAAPSTTTNNPGPNASSGILVVSGSEQAAVLAVGGVFSAEQHFVSNNQTLKALIALCHGVKNEVGVLLLDMETEPWATVASSLRAKGSDYRSEISRRWANNNPGKIRGMPRPKNWSNAAMLSWLEANPIIDANEIAYLESKVKENRIELVEAAAAEATLTGTAVNEDGTSKGKAWTGPGPFLRMLYTIVSNANEKIKDAFLHRNDLADDRLALDGRNHAENETCWDMIAEEWNDPFFNPPGESLPQVHAQFRNPIDMSWESIAGLVPATAEKCQDLFEKAMVKLKHMMAQYAASGQGSGGVRHGTDTSERGLFDKRQNFLNDRQPYFLYLWYILEKHELMTSAVEKLGKRVSASNGASGVPSIIHDMDGDDDDEDDDDGKRLSPVTVDGSSCRHSSKKSAAGTKETLLSNSIKYIGDQAVTVAKFEAEQQEKSRQLQRDLADKAEKQRELEYIRSRIKDVDDRIDTLRNDKRKLEIHGFTCEKKSKAFDEYITNEVHKIDSLVAEREAELEQLKHQLVVDQQGSSTSHGE